MGWQDSDTVEFLRALVIDERRNLSTWLYSLVDFPEPRGNKYVISYLEHLIEDRRGCLVIWRVPFYWGEMRWLAARVLAYEYALLGINKCLVLEDVVIPVEDIEIITLASRHSLSFDHVEDPQSRFAMKVDDLIRCGLLPTTTELINPIDFKKLLEYRKINRSISLCFQPYHNTI